MGGRHAYALVVLLFAFAGGVLTACAGAVSAHAGEPLLTAARLRSAIELDQPDAAYALLDPDVAAQLSAARFRELWRENRRELLELAAQLQKREQTSLARAHVALADDEQVPLVLERGQWRLSGGVFDAQALTTPFDAVLELRRALLRKDLAALLGVLARERRAAFAAGFDKTLEQTSDALDMQVEIHGDTATVHLRGGGAIRLRRQAGRWQVWDLK